MTENLSVESKLAKQEIDYIKIFKIVLSRWYWIVGCIFISFTFFLIKLWYTPPVYSTNASLKFDEKKSEISELLKVSNYYDRTNKVQSETYVIQSEAVLLHAISNLDYKISYFLKGRIRSTETYPQVPYPIEIISQDTSDFNRTVFSISNAVNGGYILTTLVNGKSQEHHYNFDDTLKYPGLVFKIKSSSAPDGSLYTFNFNKKEDFLGRVAGGLSMREAGKGSNVLLLSQTDVNSTFCADILNAIVREYVNFDASQRSLAASQTIEFIEGQLKFLSDQVERTGQALENFKQRKKLVDINTSTQSSLTKITQQEAQKDLLKFEQMAISQLEQQILNNKDKLTLNFNIEGSSGGSLSTLITQLNALNIERDQKLLQFNVNSKPIQQIDEQIIELKKSLIQNAKTAKERNNKTLRYIEAQLDLAQQNLNTLPSAERDFIHLQSDFDINQKVFTYLSEKKLEAQISKAAVIPGSTIVNLAAPGWQISPIPEKFYSSGLLFGLLAGLGIIFLVRVINPYIYDKETVENLTSTPIIGIIRKFPDYIDINNRQILSLEKPKSIFAESVRSVRTNLSFLATEKKSKIICITSEIAGEGKSFVTINLASTLALIEKKVLLIGADLRRSKLHKTFDVDNTNGLSKYLSNQEELSNIILHTDIENLDFIPSGPVPPNPSELLHTDKVRELIKGLTDVYDFILIDTAPVGLVSDSIPLIRQADINLFVIRSGVSKFNAASIPDRISKEYALNNVVVVLNAFSDDTLHSRYYSTNYSSSYSASSYYYSDYSGYAGSGYYTEDDKPKWWQFKRKFFKKF
ncbi:MAG: polysaccharide biosynthesis tyrosine autokinase [Sphingobacteriales bacterium]|nr:polysaccharide biosynthesis tyrosine autokinase [Sphingobacteriales bacterium]